MFLEKASHPYTLHPTSPNPSANQSPYNSPPNPKIMATEFPMPVPQFTSSPSQYTLYSQNQPANISPTSSDPTSPSPTSPRTVIPAHTRQLRPPKSPLYVPAVLRPTDPPRRAVRQQGPPTPPQSQHNSYDDLQNAKPVSRRGTSDSGKGGLGAIYESEWSSQGLGRVTGLPTREHWKPDIHSTHCDYSTCTRPFTYFYRRHHCRRCGHIFCHDHSTFIIPLDQDANYHPRGTRVRSCESCFHDYGRWALGRSRTNSEDNTAEFTEPPTPTVSCPGKGPGFMGSVFGQGGQGGKIPGAGGESMAQSVPRDWNWSTF